MAEFTDDFNRSDGGLGSNWTQQAISSEASSIVISSNRATRSGGANPSAYYNGGTFADVEVEVDFFDNGAGNPLLLFARVSSPGDSATGYLAQVLDGGSTLLYRMDSGYDGITELDSVTNGDRAAGTRYRLSCDGSDIKLYYKEPAGAWTELLSAVDATYSSAGSGGFGGLIFCEADDFRIADIGGSDVTIDLETTTIVAGASAAVVAPPRPRPDWPFAEVNVRM